MTTVARRAAVKNKNMHADDTEVVPHSGKSSDYSPLDPAGPGMVEPY